MSDTNSSLFAEVLQEIQRQDICYTANRRRQCICPMHSCLCATFLVESQLQQVAEWDLKPGWAETS